jgi:integrase
MQKVWYRTSKECWFATITNGGRQQQIRLISAPNNRDGKQLAEKQLIQELAARNVEHDDGVKAPGWATVSHVLQAFLKHSREEHDPETAAWHERLLRLFQSLYGKVRYTRIRKKHVRVWLKKSGYNPTSQNKALGVLKRAFNWAVEEELIPKNPIAHVKKPRPLVRDRTLTAEERQLIIAAIKGVAFRDYVQAMTLTGCRPGEVARLTKENVDLARSVWIFTKHKTVKKTGKPLIVYLCPEALALTKRQLQQHPEGPIFRNSRGKPWTRNSVRLRFRNLRKKFPQLKGVIAYTYRSSFATDALESGVPDATVATLLGHTSTSTLHKFYARLSHKVDHLKNAAAQATQDHRVGHDAPPDTAA